VALVDVLQGWIKFVIEKAGKFVHQPSFNGKQEAIQTCTIQIGTVQTWTYDSGAEK
jgi:hypothetical protein